MSVGLARDGGLGRLDTETGEDASEQFDGLPVVPGQAHGLARGHERIAMPSVLVQNPGERGPGERLVGMGAANGTGSALARDRVPRRHLGMRDGSPSGHVGRHTAGLDGRAERIARGLRL